MKIAIQVIGSTQSMTMKAGATADAGADFRGVLVSATKGTVSSSVAPQAKDKLQNQDAKSQTPENKKKPISSDSTIAPVLTVTQQLPTQTVTQFANLLPAPQAASAQDSNQNVGDFRSLEVEGTADMILPGTSSSVPETQLTQSADHQSLGKAGVDSTASAAAPANTDSPAPALLAVTPAIAAPVPIPGVVPTSAAQDGTPAKTAVEKKSPPSLLTGTPTVASDDAAASISPMQALDVKVDVAQTPSMAASSIPQTTAPKATIADHNPSVSKAANASTPVAAAPAVKSVSPAMQQATEVVQAVAAPVASVASLTDVPRDIPRIVVNQASTEVTASESGKQGVPSQETPAVKAKSVSGMSGVGNKGANASSAGTQDDGGSTTTLSQVSKIAAPAGTESQNTPTIQVVNENSAASGVVNLQQTAQAVSTDAASHVLAPAQGVSVPADAAVHTLPGQAVSDVQQTQGVSSAQLIQSMRSSEMKLGMQSAEFGNISISTTLNRQALSAQISIDHSELGRALAVHLPAIEEKLGSAYGVQARVELREGGNPQSSNDSGFSNSGQQSREQRQSQGGGSIASQGATLERSAARATFTPVTSTANQSRLDIRI